MRTARNGGLIAAVLAALALAFAVVPAASAVSTAHVTVVNLLPDRSVDVYVDASLTAPNVPWRGSEDVTVLVGDPTTIRVTDAAGSVPIVTDLEIDPAIDARLTYVLYEDGSGGVVASLFEDANGPVAPGYGQWQFQNVTPYGPLDVWVDGVKRYSGLGVGEQMTMYASTGAIHTVAFVEAGGSVDEALFSLAGATASAGTLYIVQFGVEDGAWFFESRGVEIPIVPVVFTDVAGTPFEDEIMWLADEGVTRGWDNGDGTADFRPFDSISRDAMAVFLYRYAGSPLVALPLDSPFVDVPRSYQFFRAIYWLYSEGITTGWETPDGLEFRPYEPISRDAMAAFLYRFADPGGLPISVPDFSDVPPTQPFYFEIAWLASTGISTGWADGTFRPYTSITRDAMAAFLYRLDAFLAS